MVVTAVAITSASYFFPKFALFPLQISSVKHCMNTLSTITADAMAISVKVSLTPYLLPLYLISLLVRNIMIWLPWRPDFSFSLICRYYTDNRTKNVTTPLIWIYNKGKRTTAAVRLYYSGNIARTRELEKLWLHWSGAITRTKELYLLWDSINLKLWQEQKNYICCDSIDLELWQEQKNYIRCESPWSEAMTRTKELYPLWDSIDLELWQGQKNYIRCETSLIWSYDKDKITISAVRLHWSGAMTRKQTIEFTSLSQFEINGVTASLIHFFVIFHPDSRSIKGSQLECKILQLISQI